ncbi:unnamed protein product, partial [Owenia fusiformis]
PMCINDCGLFGGFKYNDLGCQTCDCNEPVPIVDPVPCPPVNCDAKFCKKVQHPDLPNCFVCECYPPPPDTACRDIPCTHDCKDRGGFKWTSSGCPTCECNDCPTVTCTSPCSSGFKIDENGCFLPTCECYVPECPMFRCPNDCSNGYKKDHYGCMSPTCECNPSCQTVRWKNKCKGRLR